ncbi:ras family small GTPase [Naegleria gruberi]|uniref:Ras family small GTPase n=1 Tax=Naegleria gruberi TaxID=5762 RepID=D2VRU7_NAEGR|nr:ras family small GTPase [Naegleria gruberi]EFC40526.1 ras family small GTPase [Naegleria gruberi]|eukprot:XP_002673270.1 ras family small GTPase [Naegleria gruberi strain NEG-M]
MPELSIAIVGGGATGKSSITIRHIENKFNTEQFYDPTIEDSYMKEEIVDGETFFVDILDTAGQEEFYSLRDVYMRQRDGFILVYDVTNRKSLDEIRIFVEQVKRAKNTETIPFVLVGNKCDLTSERQVSNTQGKNLAESLQIKHFFETSAKTGQNINECFEEIIRETNSMLRKKSIEKKKSSTTSVKKQRKCCIM